MVDKNEVIENEEVVKEILNRLSDKKRKIFLFDDYDNSMIAVDDVVIDMLRIHYMNKMRL